MRFRILIPVLALTLSACGFVSNEPTQSSPAKSETPLPNVGDSLDAERAARQFVKVVKTVEPIAEQECRERTSGVNCDFNIVVDDRPNQAPNAFQTLDKSGRPVLAFNIPLIATVKNADELAFVMGHEAAHHIEAHIAKQKRNATAGAVIFGGIAAITGVGDSAVQTAQEVGASLGSRTYSKEFELEADRLGTVITHKAGYDPVRGAAFFTRIADPGDAFLGTHPPNAARIETVRQTAASLN
ncbi:M48 family metallopeptidase [Planktotalea sp.]|uniref:M48 family metallopeptidase n=1 Tax=Planktotalea sp. TaxID=2029877 RepID=UPI003D6B9D1A